MPWPGDIKLKCRRRPFIVEEVSDERRPTRLLHKDKPKILQKFTIGAPVGFDGDFDERSFLNNARKQVVKLLDKHRQSKVKLGLICDMVKVNTKTGEDTVHTPRLYNNKTTTVLKATDLNELYDRRDHRSTRTLLSLSRKAQVGHC